MSDKPKSGVSTKPSKILDSWKDALEAITINEENWCCMIVMMIESLPEHAEYVRLFDSAAETRSRKVIYPLTYKRMMNDIKNLSKIDRDKCPEAQGAFHHANKLISQGESLNAQLVAKLIKYLVFCGKTEAIMRSKEESSNENQNNQELRAMLTTAKIESQRSIKSAKSKKSEKSVEIKSVDKPNTHLRKYGEEWKDKVYIDDAPTGGPDLYVILTGFQDPALPLELLKARLPLACILKIKTLQVDNHRESSNDPEKPLNTSDLSMGSLENFWSFVHKCSNDPKNLDYFSSVIFQNFCPPEIPKNNEDLELLKKDLYDKVSCIMYDIYDLQQVHVDYIESMKLENVRSDLANDRTFHIYESIMDDVPAECSFVSVILQAMLAQVEADCQDDDASPTEIKSNGSLVSNSNVTIVHPNDVTDEKTLSSSINLKNSDDQASDHESKLEKLNLKYGINLQSKQTETQKQEFDVILADDKLKLKTYHVHLTDPIVQLVNAKTGLLASFALRSLRYPGIIDLWKFRRNVPVEVKAKNDYHIKKLTDCFGNSVDSSSVIHFLHLQIFDEMIHGRLNRVCFDEQHCSIMEKRCILGGMRSESTLLSSKTAQDEPTLTSTENSISNLLAFDSDGIIDYAKTICDIFECPELFELKDTREMVQSGIHEISKRKLCESQTSSKSVSEFTDIQILSGDVFLQRIQECLNKFKGFQTRYLEITDTILLYFSEEKKTLGLDDARNSQVIKLVTPVCLRDFCEYVIKEEAEWFREKVKKKSETSITINELTRKLSRYSDIVTSKVMEFTDEDFILPYSLKGQTRKQLEEKLLTELKAPEKISIKTNKQTVKNDTKKKKSAPKSREKNSKDTKIEEDIVSSSLPEQKVLNSKNFQHKDRYKFVGYDLGNRRVQLATLKETFSSVDGTLVEVDCDEWLYNEKVLGIGIHLSGCFLKLENVIGTEYNDNKPFHLISNNGVIMAFIREQKFQELNDDTIPRFDFRASWPSSLQVELVRDDNFEKSFYILQRYISKGPECQLVSRENYRKFLRNGTVLKFLENGAVEVMRPNGTIVRCLEFQKFQDHRSFEIERDGELTKGTMSRHKQSKSLVSTRGQRKASSPGRKKITPVMPFSHNTNSLKPLDQRGVQSHQEEPGRAKITRYTALEHNGRYYEVVNDEVFQVFDDLPVTTRTDFAVSKVLTWREDGMQSILDSTGELVVSFPDGTRITTGFVIESEPVFCDWSDEELDKFFGNISQPSLRPSQEILLSHRSNITQSGSEISSNQRPIIRNKKRLGQSLDDGFVSVLMTCRMEHECYTTVAYDQSDQSCKLSMPDEIVIEILPQESYISIGKNITLQVTEDNLTFLSRFNENTETKVSTSVYYFRKPKLQDQSKTILLATTDSNGKVFKVYDDGSVVRKNAASSTNKVSANFSGQQQRLFAMKRDFTAHEYLHKSKINEYQQNSVENSRFLSIPDSVSGSRYLLFLTPLESANYSKMWLQKMTKLGEENHDKCKLLRSTYSIPYDWTFPFGRYGNGVRKNTWNVPIGKLIKEDNPEVLTLTIFQDIAGDRENVLMDMQKALKCYWRTVMNERRTHRTPKFQKRYQILDKDNKNWILDLALGIQSTIRLETYLSGISTNQLKLTNSENHETLRHVKRHPRRIIDREAIQWYEKCIRERIVLPYFESIRGSCFLWIMNCVDRAVEQSSSLESSGKIDKNSILREKDWQEKKRTTQE